ncbi:Flp family type IVb pilin [Methylocystis heyeri]|uniref:Flp family type IVb pilin n=1 Tax=Methylocystis heyeri TaxID=391905 RepID=A0A6B8KE26_9HYPH|nr:Flp family type IVb pilin [Methylocystis heyeri]QGM45852.1 Flp family type IVb pilin [Methylocystis heyeri]
MILPHFLPDEDSGAAAIEYGLFAALMSIVAISIMSAIGSGLALAFNEVAGNLM